MALSKIASCSSRYFDREICYYVPDTPEGRRHLIPDYPLFTADRPHLDKLLSTSLALPELLKFVKRSDGNFHTLHGEYSDKQ